MTLGIVTGLTAEARLARPLGLVRAGGGMPEGAVAATEWLIEQGVDGLLSFGLAGGLDPALAPGAIIVPETVLDGDQVYATAPHLSASLGLRRGTLLGGTRVAATAAEKARLFARTGALAVDLETGPVARVAARHGVPFAALRAICDPAGRNLPPAALVALDRHGSIGILPVLASLASHPGQIGSLIALVRDAATARAALRQRVRGT